jgi:hypothetical protein
MNKIAIILTTFLRDNLLLKTVKNLQPYLSENLILLIGDQGYPENKGLVYSSSSFIFTEYYGLPFDCGLSYSRNYLINIANQLDCDYILMLADSIQFSQPYNFQPFIDILDSKPYYGLIGFDLENSKCTWEFNVEIKNHKLCYSLANYLTIINQETLKEVDICRNVFLAKTKALLNLWDNEMKLSEHTLAFLELKKRGYKCFWTDALKFKRINNQNNAEYDSYRKRAGEYRKLLYKKLDITGCVFPPKPW